MDLISGSFVLLMCFVGALVALLADNLGRHIGKSRKTIGKLRPRHTATLLTASAGFFIPLITILFVAGISRDLRTILREGSRLVSEKELAQKELLNTKTELGARTSEVAKKVTEVKNLESQRTQISGQLTKAQSEVKIRQMSVVQLQGQTRALQNSAAGLKRSLSVLAAATKKAQSRIASEEARNRELTQRNATLDKSYARQRAEFGDLDRERDRLVREVTDLETNLKKVAKALTEANANTASAQSNFDEMSRRLNERVEQLSLQIRSKEQELAGLFEQAADIATVPRKEKLILRMNDELARGTIAAGSTIPEAKRLISSLRQKADATARSRGATGAVFAPRDVNGRVITAEDQENALLEDLINQSTEQVIVMTSVWNVYSRESVPIRYFRYPNQVVYAAGSIVSETRIDGRKPEAKIIKDITTWLEISVLPKLANDGMLPATGRQEGGELISVENLVTLSQLIHKQERFVRLQILPKKLLRRADSPDFDFRIR